MLKNQHLQRGFGAVKLCGVVEPLANVPLNDKLLFEVFLLATVAAVCK